MKMGSKLCQVFIWVALLCSPHSTQDYPTLPTAVEWVTVDSENPTNEPQGLCHKIKPTARDIIRRVYAALPYLDRHRQNTQHLQMFRATLNSMSEGEDVLDREAAFYAAVLTPLIFLQHYRDAWCLLERFQHAMRRYQTSTPAEKRTTLKALQNLRDLDNKILFFINTLPVRTAPSLIFPGMKDAEWDEKGLRFFKDVINNLD